MRIRKKSALVLGLICFGVLGGTAVAAVYTWQGETSDDWDGVPDNWWRPGCDDPCFEYPDDAGDSALVEDDATINYAEVTIGDLTVRRVSLTLEGVIVGQDYQCASIDDVVFASVEITAQNGETGGLSLTEACFEIRTD